MNKTACISSDMLVENRIHLFRLRHQKPQAKAEPRVPQSEGSPEPPAARWQSSSGSTTQRGRKAAPRLPPQACCIIKRQQKASSSIRTAPCPRRGGRSPLHRSAAFRQPFFMCDTNAQVKSCSTQLQLKIISSTTIGKDRLQNRSARSLLQTAGCLGNSHTVRHISASDSVFKSPAFIVPSSFPAASCGRNLLMYKTALYSSRLCTNQMQFHRPFVQLLL